MASKTPGVQRGRVCAKVAPEEHAGDSVRRRHANGKCDTQANAEPIDEVGQNALAIVGNDQDH